jgi:hypothetical protein
LAIRSFGAKLRNWQLVKLPNSIEPDSPKGLADDGASFRGRRRLASLDGDTSSNHLASPPLDRLWTPKGI